MLNVTALTDERRDSKLFNETARSIFGNGLYKSNNHIVIYHCTDGEFIVLDVISESLDANSLCAALEDVAALAKSHGHSRMSIFLHESYDLFFQSLEGLSELGFIADTKVNGFLVLRRKLYEDLVVG